MQNLNSSTAKNIHAILVAPKRYTKLLKESLENDRKDGEKRSGADKARARASRPLLLIAFLRLRHGRTATTP